jgi:hypothetical protein
MKGVEAGVVYGFLFGVSWLRLMIVFLGTEIV